MIKLLINGIHGRMGTEVLKEASSLSDFEVIGGVDRSANSTTIPVYDNPKLISEKPDVIVDFSVPEGTIKILEYAKENSIPLVIATTGFSNDDLTKIEEYAKYIPIFKSSNMSYEINIMIEIVSELAKKLKDSDIEIIETHHRNKVDSPSGTALMIADSINNALNNEMEYVYDRHLVRQKRTNKEIGIQSIRGGTEAGKHTVLFLGENESLEITHNVTSRNIFAKGALKAAKYIVNKDNGLYTMKDLIKGDINE